MKLTNRILFLWVMLLLGGCAFAPPPNPSADEYRDASSKWIDIRRCTMSNRMSPELAAVGDWHVKKILEYRTVDPATISNYSTEYERTVPYASDYRCTELSIHFAQIKRNLDGGNAPRGSSTPNTTTCNRLGTMTYCNSF
jgi:hypothetical protein